MQHLKKKFRIMNGRLQEGYQPSLHQLLEVDLTVCPYISVEVTSPLSGRDHHLPFS
jgi:hypothetical protein